MDGAVCFLPEQRLWASGSLCIARVRTDGLREQGLPAVEVLPGSDGVEGEEEADSPAEPAASPHPEFAGFVAGVMERECDQL
ncbi:MAG: hypothetical protein OXF73_02545 [Gammaproteobacteria bacterium]|nr:hypothetical protein [Gammaproteobacteria bacterium]MCY4228592.1 hypothetical protein [Gammaproteobacteria bacterium]